MSSLTQQNLDFDFLLCMTHNVAVELNKKQEHFKAVKFGEFVNKGKCEFLGEKFNIKKPARKLSFDISKRLVEHIKAKENIKKYEKRYEERKKRKRLEQEKFRKQMPVGDSIINLEMVDL